MVTPQTATSHVAALEHWGKLFLRPSLQLTHAAKRGVEIVSVQYSNNAVGQSKYVRAWVYNFFGFPARNCKVFVNRISVNGKVEEEERSALQWTDIDRCFEIPIISRGFRNGQYVDICAADSVDPRLQFLTVKGLKGYHRFSGPGVYKIEPSAEALKPCSFGMLTLFVEHDGQDWKGLKVASVQEGKKWSRWL